MLRGCSLKVLFFCFPFFSLSGLVGMGSGVGRAPSAGRESGQPAVGTWGEGGRGRGTGDRVGMGVGWQTGAWGARWKSGLPGQDGRGSR